MRCATVVASQPTSCSCSSVVGVAVPIRRGASQACDPKDSSALVAKKDSSLPCKSSFTIVGSWESHVEKQLCEVVLVAIIEASESFLEAIDH